MDCKSGRIQELFGIDGCSLGLFRIGIALIVLYDLSVRASDLSTFYTDEGVLPRSAIVSSNPWIISLHLINGSAAGQTILFLIQGLCAVGLLVGYRTRLVSILTWFLMASLQRRNPLLLGGADNYLRMMLFWGMFLPLNIRYSLDNVLRPRPDPLPSRIFGWATAAILLQTFFVYFFTALYKWRGEYWREGSALFYTFHIDLYAKEFSGLFLQFPFLLKCGTYFILIFESAGPFLLFFPFLTTIIRTLTVFIFILMQLGFSTLLYLELFPPVSIVSLMLFLPTPFWSRCFKGSSTGSSVINLPPAEYKISRANNLLAAFFLIFVLFWLCAQLVPARIRIPKPLQNFGTMIYIDQQWKMFAPNPAGFTGWLVIPGTLKDASSVDLYQNGAPLNWDKPEQEKMFKNERWRKYIVHFVLYKSRHYWDEYARYLCHSWNEAHERDKELVSLEIDVMTRRTLPDKKQLDYTKRVLLRYDCMDKKVTYQMPQKK